MVRNADAVEQEVSDEIRQKPGPEGGRPQGGEASAARELGVPRSTVRDAKKHVSDLDAYPFMQGKGWKRSQASDVREALDRLSEKERVEAITVLDLNGVDGPSARTIADNLAYRLKPQERREIYKLAASGKFRDEQNALALAAELPPLPDPRLKLAREARDRLVRCAKETSDELSADFKEAANTVADLVVRLEDKRVRANG